MCSSSHFYPLFLARPDCSICYHKIESYSFNCSKSRGLVVLSFLIAAVSRGVQSDRYIFMEMSWFYEDQHTLCVLYVLLSFSFWKAAMTPFICNPGKLNRTSYTLWSTSNVYVKNASVMVIFTLLKLFVSSCQIYFIVEKNPLTIKITVSKMIMEQNKPKIQTRVRFVPIKAIKLVCFTCQLTTNMETISLWFQCIKNWIN